MNRFTRTITGALLATGALAFQPAALASGGGFGHPYRPHVYCPPHGYGYGYGHGYYRPPLHGLYPHHGYGGHGHYRERHHYRAPLWHGDRRHEERRERRHEGHHDGRWHHTGYARITRY